MSRINFYLKDLPGCKFALELGKNTIEVICLKLPGTNIPEGGAPIKGTKMQITRTDSHKAGELSS